MYDVVTQSSILSNLESDFNSLIAMYRAAENNFESLQTLPIESRNLVVKKEPQELNSTEPHQMDDARAASVNNRRLSSSRDSPSIPREPAKSTSRNEWSCRNMSQRSTESTLKRKSESNANIALDLSTRKRRRSDNGVECKEKPQLTHSKNCQPHDFDLINSSHLSMATNHRLPFQQLSSLEHSVVTDCAETKPSSNHVFMKFKVDRMDASNTVKPKFVQGKYKSYLAAYHQHNNNANDQTFNSNSNETIRMQQAMVRERIHPNTNADVKKIYFDSNAVKQTVTEVVHDSRQVRSMPVYPRIYDFVGDKFQENELKRIYTSRANRNAEDISEKIRNMFLKMNETAATPKLHFVRNNARQPSSLCRNQTFGQNRSTATESKARSSSTNLDLESVMQLSLEQYLDHFRSSRFASADVNEQLSRSRHLKSQHSNSSATSSHLGGSRDWTSIETGRFPAFGKFPLSNNRTASSRARTGADEKYDEEYISEKTKNILRRAKRPIFSSHSTSLHCLASTDVKHRCPGCANREVSTPKLISEIWRYRKTDRYTTPLTSANVVYCSQLQARPKQSLSSVPVTSCSGDAIKNFNREKIHNLATVKNQQAKITSCSKTNAKNEKKEKSNQNIDDDDLLANFIECSSDEDDEQSSKNEQNSKSRYLSSAASFPSLLKSSLFASQLKPFVKDVAKKNSSLHHPILINVRSLAPNSEKEVSVSDLEISDDDDDERSI